TLDNLVASVFSTVWTGGNNASGTQISNDYVDRTWVIGEETSGGSILDLTFEYNATDELTSFNRANCAIVNHNGSNWVTAQAYGPVAGSNPYTRSVSGITTPGNYSIQSNFLSPLPVSLLDFSAVLKNNDGVVCWKTMSEINVDSYILERSVDGNNFNEIANQTGQTQTSGYRLYEHSDKNV